ncbi:hypothetical protein ACFL3V_03830 [Nanoarchaeota archaeon]
MIYELIENPETDIISALEQKCDTSSLVARFYEDPRVHKALHVLENTEYDLELGMHNLYNQLCFHDDTWMRTFLLKQVGKNKEADGYRKDFLKGYDPFKAYNPVVKGFAYCEQIDAAETARQLEVLIDCMDFDFEGSDDQHIGRMHPYLKTIAGTRLRFLERKEAYEFDIFCRVSDLVQEGDALAKDWQLQAASERYEKAGELAEYRLRRPELVKWISGRMEEIADNYLLREADERDEDMIGSTLPELERSDDKAA